MPLNYFMIWTSLYIYIYIYIYIYMEKTGNKSDGMRVYEDEKT